MVTYRGYKTQIQYAAETSFGTGSPNTALQGKIINFTFNQANNLLRTTGLGEGRNETFVGWGPYSADWAMEFEVGTPEFLQFLIGPLSGSGTTIAPYYLEEADFRGYSGTVLKTFAMEVAGKDASGGTDMVHTFLGSVINTCGFTVAVGDKLRLSMTGFSYKVTRGTSATAFTVSTAKPWIFSQGNFKWNGSNIGRVTSATVNISNEYEQDVGRELGNRFVSEMEPGLRKYDWTITVKMSSAIATSLMDDFYGTANTPNDGVSSGEPTLRAIILDFSEGSDSGERNMQVLLSNCAIESMSVPINIGENIVEMTINGTAKAGTTDTVNKPIKFWTAT